MSSADIALSREEIELGWPPSSGDLEKVAYLLRGAPCACCGGETNILYIGIWVPDVGAPIAYVLCERCEQAGRGNEADRQRVLRVVEQRINLKFAPPQGSA